MTKTIDQSKIKTKIGCVFKAKCIHYLEPYKDLGRATYTDDHVALKINEVATCVKIENHPRWDNCFAVQFLYNCRLLWLTIPEDQFIGIMSEEFELITP